MSDDTDVRGNDAFEGDMDELDGTTMRETRPASLMEMAAEILAGAAAGAAVGSIAGPPGAVAGTILGTLLGTIALQLPFMR